MGGGGGMWRRSMILMRLTRKNHKQRSLNWCQWLYEEHFFMVQAWNMQQKTSINDISCSCCRLTGRKRDGDRLDINKVLFLGHYNAASPPPPPSTGREVAVLGWSALGWTEGPLTQIQDGSRSVGNRAEATRARSRKKSLPAPCSWRCRSSRNKTRGENILRPPL